MYCQDSVLKENWPVLSGELYVIGPEGSTPRRAEIEISLILWPEKQIETTKRFAPMATFENRLTNWENTVTITTPVIM